MSHHDARRVLLGEPTPWGPARPICKTNPVDGRWACASHAVGSFEDPDEFHAHIADPGWHRIVWRCRVHGPEGFGAPVLGRRQTRSGRAGPEGGVR